MTAKTMAEVIEKHLLVDTDACDCNEMFYDTRLTSSQIAHEHSLHVEMELHNAGFGLVADAGAKAEFAIFRKLDAEDYPEPFDSTILATREQAEWHIKRNYKESARKWLEVRTRTAPTTWARAAAVRGEDAHD